MHQSFAEISPKVVCRPALLLDTPGMLALCSQIWEGDDYIPDAWDEWLLDSDGVLAIAELVGRVVGIGKLTKLSENNWWLEGLRVHPEFEGKGIASHIHKYLLDIWEKSASGKIRFATVNSREAVKHLAEVNGFQRVGEYSTFKSRVMDSMSENMDQFSLIKSSEKRKIIQWLDSSSKDRLPFGLMDLGWQFAPPSEQYFAEFINANQVWWWRNDKGILILVKKEENLESWGRVRMLACDRNDLVELISHTQILAAQIGYVGISWLAPLIPGIEQITAEAGLVRDWDLSLLIFEKSSKGWIPGI
ncbi:MAG: GNAT family N-acetyltransferase [Anaerolineales bacterium]|jgi:GNAT superfamily N-acetyltransferase